MLNLSMLMDVLNELVICISTLYIITIIIELIERTIIIKKLLNVILRMKTKKGDDKNGRAITAIRNQRNSE